MHDQKMKLVNARIHLKRLYFTLIDGIFQSICTSFFQLELFKYFLQKDVKLDTCYVATCLILVGRRNCFCWMMYSLFKILIHQLIHSEPLNKTHKK